MMKTAPRFADPSPIDGNSKCVCCDGTLADDFDYCEHCLAPGDLSRLAIARECAQRFISVLGASGAGKTVYLGLLLDMLGSGDPNMRGSATGNFSIDLRESVVTALEHRSFPEKTPLEADGWNWIHSEICLKHNDRESYHDLIAPDVAGESISVEVQRPGTYPAIQKTIEKSQGVMILCDSLKVRDAGPGEDLFALKLATYIAALHGGGRSTGLKRRRADVALAIVFTKCDSCPEATTDPEGLAKTNMPRLVDYCRLNFSRHAFFSASVAGSSATLSDPTGRHRRIPLHVEPRGILEPLRWIIR